MTDYKAPLRDMTFTLDRIIGLSDVTSLPRYADATPDVVAAVLEEAGKFTSGVLGPLRRVGDQQGSKLENGQVRTPDGFKEAYAQYVEGGWNGLSNDPEFGGQGLPFVLSVALMEMITSANMAFGLCPMLGQGAVEALQAHASDDLKNRYLANLISGQWTGTMNLTEPQAGTDVGALRTKAEPVGDGTYKISGQKIFITWGDHDVAENIIHLVLARLPDAPAGTKGISLFLVPKFFVKDDGSLGDRNDLRVVSLEHKLGIHASPTCVMSYGDNGQCIGYLIGEENKGMRSMFTMMNHARLNVGVQGIGMAELAYQQAYSYALDRVQGTPIGVKPGEKATIIEHADVRRMLLTIKSSVEAVRAIAFLNAKAIDLAHHGDSADVRAHNQGLADLLTPLSKAYGTDLGVELSSLAVQVHGGMGYIEETGVAQTFRDARITPIYEGTNGVQAMDLVSRKLNQDGGQHWQALFREIDTFVAALPSDGDLGTIKASLADALTALQDATAWTVAEWARNPRGAAAGATPYLRLFSMTVGAYLLGIGAKAALNDIADGQGDRDFLKARVVTARFYAEQLLPPAVALAETVRKGDDLLFALSPAQLAV